MRPFYDRSNRDCTAGCGDGRPVRSVVARLEQVSDQDEVPVRDLVHTCGNASFVPALLVPALLVVSPVSGIPLVSSLCGIGIALIAAQMLWRRDHLSLPGFIMDRKLPGDRLRGALRRSAAVADFMDRHTRRNRFSQLVASGGRVVPQALCVIAGGLMPVFELVPFTSSILGSAVLCFAVSFLTRDGLFVVFGMTIMAAAALVPFFVLRGVF